MGTLTVEAHRIFEGVDELLSTGTIQLFEGTTLVTFANGYVTGSDGYTGILDSGDISGSAIIELKDGSAGAILDSITLIDVDDASGVGSVVLTDIDEDFIVDGDPVRSGIRFNRDGSISELEYDGTTTTYKDLHLGEWWDKHPEGVIGDSYDVRALSAGKTGTWSSSGAADDVWVQMNLSREWYVQAPSGGQKQCIATFEIRLTGSGSALDSATVDLLANDIF